MTEPLRILFLAAEATPFVKVGGLGDVAGSLPPALRNLSPEDTGGRELDVRLAIPYHGEIQRRLPNPEHVADFLVTSANGATQAQVYSTLAGSQPVYLIGGPPFPPDSLVYSLNAEEDGEKYVFFSLAALELIKQIDWQPDIIHANDWHTALALYSLCRSRSQDPFYAHIRSVLTIHNLPFMGGGTEGALANYGIPAAQTRKLPHWARTFPLPLGLLTADKIVAVSPSYAQEIQTPEFGCGLQDFLSQRAEHGDVSGIINGLDTSAWDPAHDVTLDQTFDIDSLDRRAGNKAALQEEVGLPIEADIPLLILIGRMDPQKGVDIAIEVLSEIKDRSWQAILLGTGVPFLESAARSLEVEFPQQVRSLIRFDANLARHLYAGGDILLMPSRYEPCGLAQMIAMRYGCVPLARATGGLQDTIKDADLSAEGTGFLFEAATFEAMHAAVIRALNVFEDVPRWRLIQKNGMRQDFSWRYSARKYFQLYQALLEEHAP